MYAILGGSLSFRTSSSDDIFGAKTDVAHQHKESNDNVGNNDKSRTVMLNPLCVVKSKVATTTPKTSILFNQVADIKVCYFGKFEFVDIQRAHRETFDDDHMIFTAQPTNKNKTMAEKGIYELSEICMFDVFIHMIRKFYVGTDNVDDSNSTQ